MASSPSLSLWENFIESIAQVLSRSLSNEDTENIVVSFQAFQQRLRDLSVDNLKRLQEEEKDRSPFCKHKGRCSTNCTHSLIRSFAISYALKYSLGFFPSILSGKVFSNPSILLKIGGKDTISFSLFMSFFISSYKGTLCWMRHIRKKNDFTNSLVAGSIAGLSILLDRNKTRRVMIALYLSTRTVHFLSRWLWRGLYHPKNITTHTEHSNGIRSQNPPFLRPKIGFSTKAVSPLDVFPFVSLSSFTPPTSGLQITGELEQLDKSKPNQDHKHPFRIFIRQTSGLILMMLTSSQILNAYVCEPHTVARSYLSFLITHGGIRALQPKYARKYLEAMGSVLAGSTSGRNDGKFLIKPEGTSYIERLPDGISSGPLVQFEESISQHPHEYVLCSLQHPHTSSCTYGMMTAFYGEWWRALNMYAPLNAVLCY